MLEWRVVHAEKYVHVHGGCVNDQPASDREEPVGEMCEQGWGCSTVKGKRRQQGWWQLQLGVCMRGKTTDPPLVPLAREAASNEYETRDHSHHTTALHVPDLRSCTECKENLVLAAQACDQWYHRDRVGGRVRNW